MGRNFFQGFIYVLRGEPIAIFRLKERPRPPPSDLVDVSFQRLASRAGDTELSRNLLSLALDVRKEPILVLFQVQRQ